MDDIVLTDLPKSGGAMAPPAPPGTTPLHSFFYYTPKRICYSGHKDIIGVIAKLSLSNQEKKIIFDTK